MWRLVIFSSIFLYFAKMTSLLSAADLSVCSALNTDDHNDLSRAIECVSELSNQLEIDGCDDIEPNERGSVIKATLCSARIVGAYEKLDSSKAKLNDQATAQLANKNNQISALQSQLANVKVAAWHTFSIGEYDRPAWFRPRHYCYHDVDAEAKKLCGGREPHVNRVSTRSGDKCGYSAFVVACIQK